MRELLAEHGIIFKKGITYIRKELMQIVEEENELSSSGREMLRDLYEELVSLDTRIKLYDKKLKIIYENDPTCQRIGKIEGIGIICATALKASISDATIFKNGRQMSAWAGLTLRQCSSGDKTRLLGISKRGIVI